MTVRPRCCKSRKRSVTKNKKALKDYGYKASFTIGSFKNEPFKPNKKTYY